MEEIEDNFEKIPTREEVISMLIDRGIDDPEVKTALLKYDEVCRATVEALDEDGRERLNHSIDMARLYFEANYREYAIESLQELLMADLSDDMYEVVMGELEEMYKRLGS